MNRNWMMRLTALAVGAAGLLGTGCSTMNQTEKGTLAGGAIGAGIGTLIGSASGNPKTGAVVGGLLGAGTGALIGNEADRKDDEARQVRQAAVNQAYRDEQPARIAQIIDLTRNGQDETVILNYIRSNHLTFVLSVDDLNTLKANNVSPRVISAMQNNSGAVVTTTAPPKTVVVREQVIVREPPPPVVFVEPYRPPPPAGVVFVGGSRRW